MMIGINFNFIVLVWQIFHASQALFVIILFFLFLICLLIMALFYQN